MLDQLAGVVRETAAVARENTQAIAGMRVNVEANTQAIAENTQAIADLRTPVVDLREGQAMLTQMLVEEREARQEFRRVTNEALDRIDRTLEELRRDRRNGG